MRAETAREAWRKASEAVAEARAAWDAVTEPDEDVWKVAPQAEVDAWATWRKAAEAEVAARAAMRVEEGS